MTSRAQQQAMRRIVAAMRFPGPDYYEVLRWLHEALKPSRYVEIGIFQGHSLKLAMPPTIALGIDPAPDIRTEWRTETHVARMTSSEFFAHHSLRDYLGADRFDLAFVDGAHRFEQVVDDITALEKFASHDSIVAVHDTIPLDEKTADPEPYISFHTGDVWKLIPFLKRCRPDLTFTTVRTGPSGLTLIRQLNHSRTRTADEAKAIAEFTRLTWADYVARRAECSEAIPNDQGTVLRWLGAAEGHDASVASQP